MNLSVNWKCILLFLIVLRPVFSATPVKRMDLFDNSGNSLMFVVFEYDLNGNNTGRTIYAADSTFLRKTTFTNSESGERIREQSLNFNDDTIGYTKFTIQNNRPAIDAFDQFGLNQLGTPVSYAENGENTYDIYQNGLVCYKMKYDYSTDGELDRVDILDKNSQMLYYATFTSTVKTYNHNKNRRAESQIHLSADWCRISIQLKKESSLKVCLYNLSGQLVSVPFSKMQISGQQMFQFRIGGENSKKLARGLYILRLFIDGQEAGTPHKYFAAWGGVK